MGRTLNFDQPNPDPTYEIDEEGYAFCKNQKELLEFAIEGYWKDISDLEQEVCLDRSDLIGKWFLIVHSRVFIK